MGLVCSMVVRHPVDCFALEKQSFCFLGNTVFLMALGIVQRVAGLQRVMLTPRRRKRMDLSGSFSFSLGSGPFSD
jgi:hypothetical protein